MNRWDYLRHILMPAAFELWKMEDQGMAVDPDRVIYHRDRLQVKETELTKAIITMPVVSEALSGRSELAALHLARLEQKREAELIAANAPILADRLANPKQKGGPKLVRRSEYTARISKARAECETSSRFNPGSSKQKSWLLYDIFKLPIQYNRKGPYGQQEKAITTDSHALERLCRKKETSEEIKAVLKQIQEIESLNQIRTTFIEAAIKDGCRGKSTIDATDIRSRTYASYGLHRTGSGRVASGSDSDEKAGESDTNAQNQPKEIRDIYIPDSGMCFVQGDSSQVEWFMTLILSGDWDGFKAAIEGEDRHKRYAEKIFGVNYRDVTDDQRQFAKSKCTYAISYGAGERRVAEETGLSITEAREILKAAKAAFPLVSKWQEETIGLAKQQHYLRTVYGWTRWFWDSDDTGKIINFLPQATCADMLKIMLPEAGEAARKLGGCLATTTHDSIMPMVPIINANQMSIELKAIMEKPRKMLWNTSFPAKVKISERNWLEAS